MMKIRMKWLVPALAFVCSIHAFAEKKAKAPRISPLTILESYTIPALEISGIAWRTNPETKRRELVVVGDREHKIYLVDWYRRTKDLLPVQEFDLKPLEKGTSAEQSEWESVFSDESGRVFIIQENPAQVLVVSADLKKIEATIVLSFDDQSAPGATPDPDTNSGGEGLLPLANGHFLVVKEKNPLRIIEFASKGTRPSGYKPSLSIESKGSFPLPENRSTPFVPVFTWRFVKDMEALLEDSSGLNVDAKGTLYVLGDQRNLIGKIGNRLKPNKEQLKVSRFWSIPSSIKQPEGMVIDEENRPLIAIDRKNTKEPNFFVLSPLK